MLDENEMSKRLVEFCNENTTFRKNFIALFTDRQTSNKDDVKEIKFTGNTQTGYGEPDITISFSSGFKYYIEVKTRTSTGFQENQIASRTGYAALIKANKQKIEESLGYLLDNEHDVKPCLSSTIIYWQQILELVNDFKNKALAKDIAQNIDGIASDEKLFGPDEELFGNPYQLAIFNDTVLKLQKNERITNNWIFNTFLIPAIKKVIDQDAYLLSDKGTGQKTLYAIFKNDNKEFWLNYNLTWISDPDDKWHEFFSFTFYRPWIMGVRTATKEAKLKEMTQNALKLWLFDFERNIKEEQNAQKEIENNLKPYYGDKAEIYGNPFLFANLVDWLQDGEEIYDAIVIPALKKIPNVTIKKKNIQVEDYRYIQIKYNEIDIKFNIYNFWNSKIDKYIDYHSFVFYRPWIVGVHKAKNKVEMIEYTKQSFEIWFEDLKLDNYL